MHSTRIRARIVGAIACGIMLAVAVSGTAEAKKPQAVDCDVLAVALDATDDFLDANGVGFRNYGQLVKAAKNDPALFGSLQSLVFAFSGGTILLDNPSSTVSTVAKCGLTDDTVRNVKD